MKNTLLIRDTSKLSSEVEKYLKKHNIMYDVIFSDDDNLPCIFPPNSAVTFKGSKGFKFYKYIYNENL
jgi:hypothetical protein